MALIARIRAGVAAGLSRPWVRKGFTGVLVFLALLVIVSANFLPQRLDLRAGQIAPRDIEAHRTVEYIDEAQTSHRQRLAASRIEPAYRESPAVTAEVLKAAEQAFDVIERIRLTPGLRPAQVRGRIREAVGLPLPQAAVVAAVTIDAGPIREARAVTLDVLDQIMRAGVRPDRVDEAREDARQTLQISSLTGRALTLSSGIAQAAVRSNLAVDATLTRQLRREAAESVPPVQIRILRGEIIVRRGDRLTDAHMRRLEALGLVGTPMGWDVILGSAAVIGILLGLTAFYLAEYQPAIWAREGYLVLWSLLVTLTTFLARLIVAYRANPTLIPAAAGPILLAILLRPRLALFTVAVQSLLIGMVAGSDLRAVLVAFAGGMVGVYAIRRVNHRTDLVIAGLKVGLVTALAAMGAGLLERRPLYPGMMVDAGLGVLNGLFVGVATIGLLPYLENLFGLVTPIKLLELSNPGHPLLRRLQMEAPGTYHHTIMVANLAEAAAEAIGADSLLARVGTYYHDIGKLRRPVFFVENQQGQENPHERMSPSLSALTVVAHVRDGLELARAYGLPKVVADFIPEHHGTSRMAYFYALAQERGDRPEESAYRYEGPKPQSRETAIVMLADAVEAAVRALPRPTPDRIRDTVWRIVRERLDDGQLDECDLAFRDLEKIVAAFTRILTTMFHPRIEYPDLEGDVTARRRERLARIR